ncbi:MAG: LEA type 2 family protein [Spirochaetes bacterium]|nr:LEA type 2 family protein [Spirochaetota bacterium]
MKKIAPVVLFCTIAACASLNLSSRPQAAVERLGIDSLSLRDITLAMDVGITNPYPIALKLQDVRLVFFVESHQMFRSDTKKGLRIKAVGKETTTFRINLKYADIMKIVQEYTQREYLNCVADITIVIPLPKLKGVIDDDLTFRYKKEIKIPAIKPSVRIANFKVHMPTRAQIEESLSRTAKRAADPNQVYGMFSDILSGKRPSGIIDPDDLDLKLKVDFDIELKNQTRARLGFSDVGYDFAVNGSPLLSGTTRDVSQGGSGTTISVSNTFSSRALGSSVLQAFRAKTGRYTLKGRTMVTLPASISQSPVTLNFDESGAFNLQ